MSSRDQYRAGSLGWLTMVGEVLVNAARSAHLPSDLTVSLVEHYIDGPRIAPGLFKGLRFDILHGEPAFRVGVMPGEVGDVTIHVTLDVARRLNQLYSSNPALAQLQQQALASDWMRVNGDPSRFGTWFTAAHDDIVSRTLGSSPPVTLRPSDEKSRR